MLATPLGDFLTRTRETKDIETNMACPLLYHYYWHCKFRFQNESNLDHMPMMYNSVHNFYQCNCDRTKYHCNFLRTSFLCRHHHMNPQCSPLRSPRRCNIAHI